MQKKLEKESIKDSVKDFFMMLDGLSIKENIQQLILKQIYLASMH